MLSLRPRTSGSWFAQTRWTPTEPVARWLVFLLAVGLTAGAWLSVLRTGGLVVLLAVVALRAFFTRTGQSVVVGLAVALLAVVLVRNFGPRHLTPTIIGWLVPILLTGAAVALRPFSVRTTWMAIGDQLKTNPGGRAAWAVAALGVVAPFVAVELQTSRHVGTFDTLPVVATVVRVQIDGTRDLTGYTESPAFWRWAAYPKGIPLYFAGPVPGRPGLYSNYPAGMEPFAWPVVAVAGVLGWDLFDEWVQLRLERVTAAGVAGLALGLFYLTALRFGSPAAAYLTTLMLATGSVFASSLGMLLWQQGGTVFWALVLVWVETRPGRPTRWGTLVQAVACGMMFACRPSAVTVLVPFGLWVLARDWRRGLLLPLLAGLAYLPWAWLYQSVYGSPFGPAIRQTGEFRRPLEHLAAVLVSPGRGLFVYQPWLVLLMLYAVPAVRRLGSPFPAGFLAFVGGAVGLHLALVGSWPMWWGGHCYGSRLLAELVPLLGLLAVRPVGWLLANRIGWVPLVVVVLLGIGLHAPCQFGGAWTWNISPTDVDSEPGRLWDWSRPPFLHDGR